MTRYSNAYRDSYRDFVEGLVDEAMHDAAEDNEEITAASIARHVNFDTELVDEMVQTRILEVLTPGSHGRTVRQATRGWAR